jgi:hypothetical protein
MKMAHLGVSGIRTPQFSYNAYRQGLGVGGGVTLEVRPLTRHVVTWPTPKAFALLASVYTRGKERLDRTPTPKPVCHQTIYVMSHSADLLPVRRVYHGVLATCGPSVIALLSTIQSLIQQKLKFF